MSINRVPEGVPTGGQFAATQRAEASVSIGSLGEDSDLDVYNEPAECAANGAHLTSVDEDGYCNHCGHDDPDPLADRHGVSDAYPNGRCPGCGSGVDTAGRCYQSDCSNVDESSPHAGYENDSPRPQDAIEHPEHRERCRAFAEQYADRIDLTDPDDFESEVARIVTETGEDEADLRERLTRQCQPRNISPLDANQTNRANGRAKVGDNVIHSSPMHGDSSYEVLGKMHTREIVGADENGVQWAESREVEYVLKNLENGTQSTASLTGAGWRRNPAPEPAEDFYDDELPCCSICDGAGHGYPGGPPCPLEVNEQQRWETDEDERRAAWFAEPDSAEPPF